MLLLQILGLSFKYVAFWVYRMNEITAYSRSALAHASFNQCRPVSPNTSPLTPIVLLIVLLSILEMIQLGLALSLPKENPFPKPPWKLFRRLELGVTSGGYSKDVVELFESSLLRFRQEEVDEEERHNVQTRIEAKCAYSRECVQDPRQR